MNLIALDFETFYSNEYTLKKLTTEEYVRDQRFEALVLGFATFSDKGYVLPSNIPAFLERLERPIGVLCHHAHFDGLILNHHYGFKPDFWFDTLPMARLLGGPTTRLSLESLAEAAGLLPKVMPYQKAKGKRFTDLEPSLLTQIGEGAVRDCELTLALFKLMVESIPEVRLHIIDQTTRMFTEPRLRGDIALLEYCALTEHIRKAELLASLQTNATEIRSSPRFQALLETEGVEIDYKLNPKGEHIPAFAKTDPFIQELLEHPNERIRTLAEARVAARSSIRETRAARLAGAARRGPLPVYLGAFGAANTLRWSAGDKTNWQNLPKEEADGGPSSISRAIRVFPGSTLVIADKAQVECRILLSVAGQHDKLRLFEEGKDPYKELASLIYHKPIEEITDEQRFVGKTATLGCGYGMGGDKFARTCRAKGVAIDLHEAENAVRTYRDANREVCLLWRRADACLSLLARGFETKLGGFAIANCKLFLPDSSYLSYTLEWDPQHQSWRRQTKGGAWRYIWGGGLVENLVQALSALDISETIQSIYNRTGERAVLLKHDEAVYCVAFGEAERFSAIVREEFSHPPSWLEYCPMNCEIAIRETLGK